MIVKLNLKQAFDNFYSQIGHSHSEGSISYTNVLNTTAQTLSGAINELKNDIEDLNDYIEKLLSITIHDGYLSTTTQDYVLINKVKEDFTVSCMIELYETLDSGIIGLGVIENLPNNSAINNIAGMNMKVDITDGDEFFIDFGNFNDNANINLEIEHEYKFVLKRKGHLYTGTIYDLTTNEILISKSIINNVNYEYLVLWGMGDVYFTYYDIQLNGDYLLKTDSQTLVGAINELYDNQEYILISCTEKINEL